MTYTVVKLAPGSYDVLLNGCLVAALVSDIDGDRLDNEWRIDPLDEMVSAERPAPFTEQTHTFRTYPTALKWLGILGEGEEAALS